MSFSLRWTGGSVNGSSMSLRMKSLTHCVEMTVPLGRSTVAGWRFDSGFLLSGP